MSTRSLFAITLVVAGILLISGSLLMAQDEDTTLNAVSAESVGMELDDPIWGEAPVLTVDLAQQQEDGTPSMPVDLQAAYTADTLFIRAVWADETLNDVRRAWHFDGESWVRGDKLAEPDPTFNNEDRLAFAFDISGDPLFSIQGCQAACHGNEDPPYYGFEAGSEERVDMWHWKATRTNAAGYADDQYASGFVDDEEEPSGRANDSREGDHYKDNINEAGDAPAFMFADMDNAGKFLLADEAVPFDPDAGWEAGDTLPYYVLNRPAGSRGDISAVSQFADGMWEVILSRPLDTGNDDDAVFTPGEFHIFGVAVFDNGGGFSHAVSEDALHLLLAE